MANGWDIAAEFVKSTAAMGGLLAIPGVYWAYRAGLKKQGDEVALARQKAAMELERQRDQADIDSLAAREKMIASLQDQLQGVTRQLLEMATENGKLSARMAHVESQQAQRDVREREQIAQIAALKTQLSGYDACDGGSPCPFRNSGLQRHRH